MYTYHVCRRQVLDTSWHNSIGTVLDALWAATPVVSMASSRASSRAAASALIAAGTPQALARDLHDYAAVARALVRRRSALCVCLMCLPYVSAYVCAYVCAYDAVARALVGLSQQQARRHELRCVCLMCLCMCQTMTMRSWALASSKRGGMSSGGGWQRRATRPCLTHGAGSPLGSAGLPWRWMRTSMPVQAVAACMRVTRVASMSLRQGRWRTQGRGRLTESERPRTRDNRWQRPVSLLVIPPGVPGILFCMTPGWFHKNHVTHPKTGSIGLPSPAACDTAELALEHV